MFSTFALSGQPVRTRGLPKTPQELYHADEDENTVYLTSPGTTKRPSVEPSPGSLMNLHVLNDDWGESPVPFGQRTAALKHYRLARNDLATLTSTTAITENNSNRTVVLSMYDERSVEQIAWEKNGGASKFLNKLRNMYYRWIQEGKDPNDFIAPASYRELIGATQINHDPSSYIASSASLPSQLSIKQKESPVLEPWLQTAANSALKIYGFSWEECNSYLSQLSGLYPRRPSRNHSSSPEYQRLAYLLKDAPDIDDTRGDAVFLEDLSGDGEGEECYGWSTDFRDRIYRCLIDIVARYGRGHEWDSARWLIYDTHTSCLGPLSFYRSEKKWTDEAMTWLTNYDRPDASELEKEYHRMIRR